MSIAEQLATDRATTERSLGRETRQPRVAYMMSRFPKITETFVLREMVELEKRGVPVEVFPLQRERTNVVQPDAEPYVRRAHFTPWLSPSIAWANAVEFCRQPGRYLGTLGTLIRANFGSPRYLAGAIGFFPKAVHFAREMRRRQVTHLHAHFASHPAAMAFVIGRLAGIPFSFTAHGSDLHRDQHMLREKTAEAAFVVAISNYNRDMIARVCGGRFAEKIRVIHCGIDPHRFPARTESTAFDRGAGPFTIVCIGTLHEVKGQTYLIEACRRLRERGIEFACHFLGGGPDLAPLREQAKAAEAAERITFHGPCTSREVQQHLQNADVVVTPSVPSRDGRREGIPVVLMEAMGSGVPCISSRLSGIPELVEDGVTGILTEPGDAAAIADALERLARDADLRRQFGAAGVKKVRSEFDLGENTAKLAESFNRVPNGPRWNSATHDIASDFADASIEPAHPKTCSPLPASGRGVGGEGRSPETVSEFRKRPRDEAGHFGSLETQVDRQSRTSPSPPAPLPEAGRGEHVLGWAGSLEVSAKSPFAIPRRED